MRTPWRFNLPTSAGHCPVPTTNPGVASFSGTWTCSVLPSRFSSSHAVYSVPCTTVSTDPLPLPVPPAPSSAQANIASLRSSGGRYTYQNPPCDSTSHYFASLAYLANPPPQTSDQIRSERHQSSHPNNTGSKNSAPWTDLPSLAVPTFATHTHIRQRTRQTTLPIKRSTQSPRTA